jgi:hypothetical protein
MMIGRVRVGNERSEPLDETSARFRSGGKGKDVKSDANFILVGGEKSNEIVSEYFGGLRALVQTPASARLFQITR